MKTIPQITEAQAKRCVTHHHACDCREYKYQQMEAALRAILKWPIMHPSSIVNGKDLRKLILDALGEKE